MRYFVVTLLIFVSALGQAQVKIHSHNDYLHAKPLIAALESKAYTIEADVFLVKGNLLVAHTYKERDSRKTLRKLYIDPIVELFKKHKGSISADSSYTTNLMIDIKQDGAMVLQELVALLKPLRQYFDRSVNPHAVQVIISGDRGPSAAWKNYPSYILFDGRPNEEYTDDALQKIAVISDNYFNYLQARNNRGDSAKIKAVAAKAHQMNKPLRLWASPDNEDGWKLLHQSNVDIINTDKPALCRAFFERRER